ncbi:MAG TPA: hypothetical protein VGB19_14605 [Actinomycetota bacterium]
MSPEPPSPISWFPVAMIPDDEPYMTCTAPSSVCPLTSSPSIPTTRPAFDFVPSAPPARAHPKPSNVSAVPFTSVELRVQSFESVVDRPEDEPYSTTTAPAA